MPDPFYCRLLLEGPKNERDRFVEDVAGVEGNDFLRVHAPAAFDEAREQWGTMALVDLSREHRYEETEFNFDTWSGLCHLWFEAVAAQFPQLRWQLTYDSPGNCCSGRMVAEGGQVIENVCGLFDYEGDSVEGPMSLEEAGELRRDEFEALDLPVASDIEFPQSASIGDATARAVVITHLHSGVALPVLAAPDDYRAALNNERYVPDVAHAIAYQGAVVLTTLEWLGALTLATMFGASESDVKAVVTSRLRAPQVIPTDVARALHGAWSKALTQAPLLPEVAAPTADDIGGRASNSVPRVDPQDLAVFNALAMGSSKAGLRYLRRLVSLTNPGENQTLNIDWLADATHDGLASKVVATRAEMVALMATGAS